MVFTIITIIFFIAGLITLLSGFIYFKNGKKVNLEVQEENRAIDQKNKELRQENSNLTFENQNKRKEFDTLNNQFNSLNNQVSIKKTQLEDLELTTEKVIENKKQLSQKAFENYCLILEQNYEEKEKEYEESNNLLEESYSEQQIKILWELDKIQEELSQLKATRAAAFQAQLKEKEILDNKDNYRLNISEVNMKDIRLLKSIQKDISNSIVIDKIIWSNYYQPLAKVKFPKIIGKNTACGIYKITSIKSGLMYIGQSLDICERWKQHCKNALGVGNTTSTNKLYNLMKEEELYNFTFEVLEECDSSLLNEKEKFYIELYDSYNFGLNGNKGNG